MIDLLVDEVDLTEDVGPAQRGADDTIQAVCERMSVVIDALAFHAGQIEDPESIHGIISLLSEVRRALRAGT